MKTYKLTNSDKEFMRKHELTESDMIGFIQDMDRERELDILATLHEEAKRHEQAMQPEHD